ncbi:MAG: copper oxidase [Robiginitomaculum sp.]|nr:MAG: copper oxidase [Robiginitomaculum sp.]
MTRITTLFKMWITGIVLLLFGASNVFAETVEYEFDIAKSMVNKTGKLVPGMTVGGQTPGPVITAREGDILRVTFHNKMDVQTSIHWHGILLPNEQDGISYLTTTPIEAGMSHTFEYPIIQSGTYWYHSHTGLQEQRGVYGAMVLHPKKKMKPKMSHMNMGDKTMLPKEHVIVFSDWSDEDPKQIMKNLKKDGDYYALKKGSVQSWAGVFANGGEAVKNRINGALSRMGPMDLSDVGYDAFLVNGVQVQDLGVQLVGEMIKLRLVNAAASTYFNVEFAGGPMTIIAADGIDVEHIQVTRLRLSVAETYDVLVKLPMDMAYELRATSEDGTGYASVWLGQGHKMPAPDIARPNLYIQSHDMMGHGDMDMGEMDHTKMGHEDMPMTAPMPMDHEQMGHSMMNHTDMDHSKMGHGDMGLMPMTQNTMKSMGHEMPMEIDTSKSVIAYMSDYKSLRSPVKTNLQQMNTRTVNLSLTGNMERYVWSFDNKILSQADSILIKKGETVKFVLKNETMMHHPIHLHGHFFRVLNGQGDYSPLKHTVNVAPMSIVIIEFAANEEKDWFFHCHNLYHMMGGMARIVSYEGSTKYTNAIRKKIARNPWYAANEHTLQNNMVFGEARISNANTGFDIEYDWDYDDTYDVQFVAKRYVNRFLSVYGGVRSEQDGGASSETHAVLGVQYVLPLLIDADLQLASDGHVELEIGSSLQLTSRLAFEWDASTDEEYRAGLNYTINNHFSLAAGWDSDQGYGGGVKLSF